MARDDWQSMDLSPEEVALIEKHRADKAAKAERQRRIGLLLNLAAEYFTWMQETGMGLTYSHFLNDFGYEAVTGVTANQMFKQLEKILELARDLNNR